MNKQRKLLLTVLADGLGSEGDRFGLDAYGALLYRDERLDDEIVGLLSASNASCMADTYARIVQAGQERLKTLEPLLHPSKVAGLKYFGTMLSA